MNKIEIGRRVRRTALLGLLAGLVACFSVLPYAKFLTQSAFAADTVTTNTLPFSTATSFVASQDGTHVVAATSDSTHPIYTSDDSGATWTARSTGSTSTFNNNWESQPQRMAKQS